MSPPVAAARKQHTMKNGNHNRSNVVLSYDIVSIPTAHHARDPWGEVPGYSPGPKFRTVSTAEIRQRNVARWRHAAEKREWSRTREVFREQGPAAAVRVAINQAQAASLQHRGQLSRQTVRRELEQAWGGL